jgi:hypothetical protein
LDDIAVVSSRDIWAVGYRGGGPLMIHWDGTSWRKVPTPSTPTAQIWAIAAASAQDVWAVGVRPIGHTPYRTLVERWNGKRWRIAPSRSPTGEDDLLDIAPTQSGQAWAVGTMLGRPPLIEYWDRRRWKVIPSAKFDQVYLSSLIAITLLANGAAWAVGERCTDQPGHIPEESFQGDWDCLAAPLIQRWDGKRWRISPVPRGLVGVLFDVAASPREVWAVGEDRRGRSTDRPLILRRAVASGG